MSEPDTTGTYCDELRASIAAGQLAVRALYAGLTGRDIYDDDVPTDHGDMEKEEVAG